VAVEFVIALVLLTALLSALAGYALARRGGPRRSQLDELQRELETAEQRAEEVQANVTGHFEQSAVLFGQLARDYRSFLEHFSESAQALGISEVKARELLARADQPLLGQTDAVIEGEPAAPDAPADSAAAAGEAAASEPADVDKAAAAPARVVDVEVDALGLPIEDADRRRAGG
jgi:uncharacterized membrane-anchored protein YhcB (DUF1043 family)